MNFLTTLLLLAAGAEQLPDGPRLVLAPSNAGTTAVHIRFAMPGDAEEQAIGRIFQSSQAVLLANTALPASWRRDLFSANAEVSSGSSREDIRFALVSAPETFQPLFTTLMGAVFKSRLTEDRFRRLADHIPSQGGSMTPNDMLINAYSGRPLLEAPPKNRLLPFDSVAGLVKRALVPANALIIVTGQFDEKAIRAVLGRFTGGSRIASEHRRPTPSQGLFTGPDDLYVVIYGFETPSLELEAKLLILQELLTSRLLDLLRNAGATYAIDIVVHRLEGLTCLMWILPSRDNSKLDLLPYIDRILGDLMKKQDDTRAFDLARQNVRKRLERYPLSPENLVASVDEGSFNPEWVTPEFLALLGDTTLPSIQRSLILRPEDRTVWRLVPTR